MLLLLILWPSFKLYPIINDTILPSILAIILAEVLVPSLELAVDTIHTQEGHPSFLRVLMMLFLL